MVPLTCDQVPPEVAAGPPAVKLVLVLDPSSAHSLDGTCSLEVYSDIRVPNLLKAEPGHVSLLGPPENHSFS